MFVMTFLAMLILFSSPFTSCIDNSNRANILPPDVQYMADTMFSKRRRAIKSEMDSLCVKRTSNLIEIAVDSIVTLEKERINKIIGNE